MLLESPESARLRIEATAWHFSPYWRKMVGGEGLEPPTLSV